MTDLCFRSTQNDWLYWFAQDWGGSQVMGLSKVKPGHIHQTTWLNLIPDPGFPGGSEIKNPPPANVADAGLILGRGDPWRRKWQPTPVFLPGKFHGQRSLASYSSSGPKRVRHDWATKQQYQAHICVMASTLSIKWKPEQDFEDLFFLGALRQVILINLCPKDVMNHSCHPTSLQEVWLFYYSNSQLGGQALKYKPRRGQYTP